jgi:thiol-disulfide isomerase/thioredoxin
LTGAAVAAGVLYIVTKPEASPDQETVAETEYITVEQEKNPEPVKDELVADSENITTPETDIPEPNTSAEPEQNDIDDANQPNAPELSEVIQNARTWQPEFDNWRGKKAPGFTITDISGQEHSLKQYRGKNVILVFWATWCQPCVQEVPSLIAIQNVRGEEELTILAISYTGRSNSEQQIKEFVNANERINYPVFAVNVDKMPEPYNRINSIPCSFFIDKEGKIKLATVGQLHYTDLKAILNAKAE